MTVNTCIQTGEVFWDCIQEFLLEVIAIVSLLNQKCTYLDKWALYVQTGNGYFEKYASVNEITEGWSLGKWLRG